MEGGSRLPGGVEGFAFEIGEASGGEEEDGEEGEGGEACVGHGRGIASVFKNVRGPSWRWTSLGERFFLGWGLMGPWASIWAPWCLLRP